MAGWAVVGGIYGSEILLLAQLCTYNVFKFECYISR